jgi:hypothetical protein
MAQGAHAFLAAHCQLAAPGADRDVTIEVITNNSLPLVCHFESGTPTHLVDQRCDRTWLSPSSSIAPDRSRLTPVGNSIGTLAR